MESHRHRRPPTTASDILDFYFESLASELGPGLPAETSKNQQQEKTYEECSRSSSVYSADTLKEDTVTPRLQDPPKAGHGDSTSMREVFRNLCQGSLHIANLRHARDEAHKALEEADKRVDGLAHELVLARLGCTDQIDSSNQAISQTMEILAEGGEKDQLCGKRDSPENGTDVDSIREAVCHAKQLKAAFYACRRQLETGQRVLLWPTLEQWRLAVEGFREAGQHRGLGEQAGSVISQTALRKNSTQSAGVPPSIITVSSLGGLDRVAREIEVLLPQLGRHRLEHLLGYITAALQQEGACNASNYYVPSFI